LQEERYPDRTMRRNPGFTLVAVLSLGLAIGANTAIFSYLNVLLLRDLPIAKPQDLVEIVRISEYGRGNFSYPLYELFRNQSTVFSGLATMSTTTVQANIDDAVSQPIGRFVSENFFE